MSADQRPAGASALERHGNLYVLDAPPVLPVVEVASLASRVDLVLLVARASVTSQKALLIRWRNWVPR